MAPWPCGDPMRHEETRRRTRSERHPWYADVIADELVRLLPTTHPGHVLAAGDFNEAYGWDTKYAPLLRGALPQAGRRQSRRRDPSGLARRANHADRPALPGRSDLRQQGPGGPALGRPTLCVGADDGLSDHVHVCGAAATLIPPVENVSHAYPLRSAGFGACPVLTCHGASWGSTLVPR